VLALVVIVAGPTNEIIQSATGVSGMDCSNPSISVTTQAACSILEPGLLFYFIGTLIAVSLAIVQGNNTIVGIVESIMIYMIVVIMITPLKSLIVHARDSLSCGVETISTGAAMICIVVDIWLFYFIIVAIAGGITYIFNKPKPT